MEKIDWDRDLALDQASGDEELLRELLTMFSGTLLASHHRLEEALAAGDFSRVAQAAHSIKGSASSLGFGQIADMADTIEKQAWDGGAGEMPEFLARLKALEAILSSLG